MKSIKNRIIGNFILIIVITVAVLEFLIISIIHENYYKSLEDTLYNQVKLSSELYTKYFSDTTLQENVQNNVDTFWKQTSARVEIFDSNGNFLFDSSGNLPSKNDTMEDVTNAIKKVKSIYIVNNSVSVSYPLKDIKGSSIGVLRFTASLLEIKKSLSYISAMFILIGGAVVLLIGCIGMFLSNSIVYPIKDITHTAELMANGNYNVKCIKAYDDEIGKLSDTLNHMAEEITKKDSLKNEFISSVSHELRTPLTSIKGWAVTLKDMNYKDEEILKDGLNIIEKESDRLTHMVEELLDFSKFVSGKIVLKKTSVNVTELILQIEKQLSLRAKRDHIDFKTYISEDIPIITCDENRLKQLFINVLDNAFRFTPAGGEVLFKANIEQDALIFLIKDNGCGIPEDELPRVKEKFFKGKSSKSQNGIGLSICDEIVKLMDGTLEIRSEADIGTEVYICLPLRSVLDGA